MDDIRTTPVSTLAATVDPREGLTLTILEVPCFAEVFEVDGRLQVNLTTVEGDHHVTVRPGAALLLVDAINSALVAHGDPLEWPGFSAGATA